MNGVMTGRQKMFLNSQNGLIEKLARYQKNIEKHQKPHTARRYCIKGHVMLFQNLVCFLKIRFRKNTNRICIFSRSSSNSSMFGQLFLVIGFKLFVFWISFTGSIFAPFKHYVTRISITLPIRKPTTAAGQNAIRISPQNHMIV